MERIAEQVKLGICVLNWNAGEMLARCVEHLRVASQEYESEIVVVDNYSRDGSADFLRDDVRVLRNSSNLGYARGNNTGARYLCSSQCNYLLFVNPDVLITASAIAALLQSLHESGAGAVGGLPQNAEGVSRMAARAKPTLAQKLVLYGPLHRLPLLGKLGQRHFLNWEKVEEGQPVYSVCGACMLFRTSVFQEAGGFDESTFLYEEELILAERLRSVGSFFVLSKGCRYFHEEARSTRLIPYRRRLHFINSEQYLLREYYKRNATLRLALRVWRYLEWTTYALSWKFRPSSSPTPVAHQRGLGHLAQDGPKPAERGRS